MYTPSPPLILPSVFFPRLFLLKKLGLEKSLTIEAHPPQFQDPDLFLKNISQ
jgi:hypothetical protein